MLICTSFGFAAMLWLYVRVHLGGIASRVGACVRIGADIGKEQLVMSGALGAIQAASGCGDKLRVAFVEMARVSRSSRMLCSIHCCRWRTGSRMRLALAAASPILTEASGKCLFLLGWLEFCQQQRMADADLLFIECLDHCRSKLRQLEALSAT